MIAGSNCLRALASVDRIEGGGDHKSACVPKPLRAVAADQEGGSPKQLVDHASGLCRSMPLTGQGALMERCESSIEDAVCGARVYKS